MSSGLEASPPPARQPLGQLLREAGLLSEGQLEAALHEGARTHERLGEIVVRHGWATEDDIAKLLADQWQLGYVERSSIWFDADALARLSREQAQRLEALPTRVQDGRVVVAVAEPTEERLAALREVIGDDTVVVVVPKAALDAGLSSDLLDAEDHHSAKPQTQEREDPPTLATVEPEELPVVPTYATPAPPVAPPRAAPVPIERAPEPQPSRVVLAPHVAASPAVAAPPAAPVTAPPRAPIAAPPDAPVAAPPRAPIAAPPRAPIAAPPGAATDLADVLWSLEEAAAEAGALQQRVGELARRLERLSLRLSTLTDRMGAAGPQAHEH